jgi:hypothetical protein
MAGDAVQFRESWVPEMHPIMGKRWTCCVCFDCDNFENKSIDMCMKCG